MELLRLGTGWDGGGTSRGAGAGTGGIGGAALVGRFFGDFMASSVRTPSSRLESRLWAFNASLCFALEAISVS